MCEILDKVENRGLTRGRLEGRAEGRLEGRAEGRPEGTELANLEAIKKMMSKLKMSAEQAMETLDIPQSDRPKYAGRI